MANADDLPQSRAANTDSMTFILTDSDRLPIVLDNNPAHIEGALQQAKRCLLRTGKFATLLEQGAKLIPSSGKLAIEDATLIQFLDSTLEEETPYGFDNPCPPSAVRIKAYDDYAEDRTALGIATPNSKKTTTVPSEHTSTYIAGASGAYMVRAEDALFASTLAAMFVDHPDLADSYLEQSANSGRAMLQLLRAKDKTATAADHQLVRKDLRKHVDRGVQGPLDSANFDAWLKTYRKKHCYIVPHLAPDDAEVCQDISALAFKDSGDGGMRWRWESLLDGILCGKESDTEAYVDIMRSKLRTRMVHTEIDQLDTGASRTALQASSGSGNGEPPAAPPAQPSGSSGLLASLSNRQQAKLATMVSNGDLNAAKAFIATQTAYDPRKAPKMGGGKNGNGGNGGANKDNGGGATVSRRLATRTGNPTSG